MRFMRSGSRERRGRLLGAGVAGVVLGIGLVACGGDELPAVTPSPAASAPSKASSSPSPSDPPPVLPAEATKQTNDGAIAFVNYWIDVVNYASEALDGELIRDVSSKSCEFCAFIADDLDRIAANRGSFNSGGWTVTSSSVIVPVSSPGGPSVATYAVFGTERRRDTARDRVTTVRGGRYVLSSSLVWSGGRWLMDATAASKP